MQENNSTQATTTNSQLVRRANGTTVIIQKDPISLKEAGELRRYIWKNYPVLGLPEIHQLWRGDDEEKCCCVKATLFGYYLVEPDALFFNIAGIMFYVGAQKPHFDRLPESAFSLPTPRKEKTLVPNIYDKINMLREAIEDAERRLGSYIASDGCEKTDKYAQGQIKLINGWSKQLDDILKTEVIEDGSN